MNPMDTDPSPEIPVVRLLALKRYEVPPPGFPAYLRGRVMRAIAAERDRVAQPWWTRLFEEVTWQRGMLAANVLAFAGVVLLGTATFQVAHSVMDEEMEVAVYTPLPLPADAAHRVRDHEEIALADADSSGSFRPLPASGIAIPMPVAFGLPETSDDDDPRSYFSTPSMANPQFILARDQVSGRR